MSYLLAHLSDAHIGPLPRPRTRDLMGKRITGFVNWRRAGACTTWACWASSSRTSSRGDPTTSP